MTSLPEVKLVIEEDPVTQLERYKRRQDAAYGAAFAQLMIGHAQVRGTPGDYLAVSARMVDGVHVMAKTIAELVPPPPPPPNERALHVRGCRCHLCNTVPAPEEDPTW